MVTKNTALGICIITYTFGLKPILIEIYTYRIFWIKHKNINNEENVVQRLCFTVLYTKKVIPKIWFISNAISGRSGNVLFVFQISC